MFWAKYTNVVNLTKTLDFKAEYYFSDISVNYQTIIAIDYEFTKDAHLTSF